MLDIVTWQQKLDLLPLRLFLTDSKITLNLAQNCVTVMKNQFTDSRKNPKPSEFVRNSKTFQFNPKLSNSDKKICFSEHF